MTDFFERWLESIEFVRPAFLEPLSNGFLHIDYLTVWLVYFGFIIADFVFYCIGVDLREKAKHSGEFKLNGACYAKLLLENAGENVSVETDKTSLHDEYVIDGLKTVRLTAKSSEGENAWNLGLVAYCCGMAYSDRIRPVLDLISRLLCPFVRTCRWGFFPVLLIGCIFGYSALVDIAMILLIINAVQGIITLVTIIVTAVNAVRMVRSTKLTDNRVQRYVITAVIAKAFFEACVIGSIALDGLHSVGVK